MSLKTGSSDSAKSVCRRLLRQGLRWRAALIGTSLLLTAAFASLCILSRHDAIYHQTPDASASAEEQMRLARAAFVAASGIELVDAPLDRIRQLIDRQPLKSQTELIDFVMSLAHDNTVHKIDQWHDTYWFDRDIILSGVYHAHHGRADQRPHSSCGPRCMIMAWILQAYGIKNRQLAVFTDQWPETILGHQQIEVLNTDSGRWELYEPSWNVHFRDARTGSRLSALDVYFRPTKRDSISNHLMIEDVVPSNDAGTLTGWFTRYPYSNGKRRLLPEYSRWGAVYYYCFQNERESYFLINRKRFDLTRKWHYPNIRPEPLTFPEYCVHHYKNFQFWPLDAFPEGHLRERIEAAEDLPRY